MKNLILGLVLLITSSFSLNLVPVKAQQKQNANIQENNNKSLVCPFNKTKIKVNYSVDPLSFDDFTYTESYPKCILKSKIGYLSNTNKAKYALKLLLNKEQTPLPTNYQNPFTYTGNGNCTSSQLSSGKVFSYNLTSSNNLTVKLCKQHTSGGIGQDARMRYTVKATVKNYFPSYNVTLKDKNGNLI
jgi:hypothetical protein